MASKVMDVNTALNFVKDGDAVAITAAGPVGYPEYLVKNLEKRYVERGSPKGLTLLSGCGHGGPKPDSGDNSFAHPGFLKRAIGSHPGVVPLLRKMIEDNALEAYVLPQGVLNGLYRCSGAKQPGLLTKIGMGTFVDPRQDGGKLNKVTTQDIVRVMEIDGEEWLFYKSLPVNVAMIRATTADENGNLTIEREALKLEINEIAIAAKATGGKVIAQVERVAAAGSLNAKDVVVPGELVDAVVVTENPAQYHMMAGATIYNPYMSGEVKCPGVTAARLQAPLTPADIICRRAAFELFPGAVVNVGLGIGAGIGPVAAVEGIEDKLTFTLELGAIGGIPQPAPNFGVSVNAVSYLSHPTMFDFYYSGGLDITFLGTAQVDKEGNVNVSKFAGHAMGQGGFIDITQTSRKVVFCTYFGAKGFEGSVSDGKLIINQEAQMPKFVDAVDQITYNGVRARNAGQEVCFITERAVFKLTREGVALVEVAPGIDIEKDILRQMDFKPIIGDVAIMDERIFKPGRMGCFD